MKTQNFLGHRPCTLDPIRGTYSASATWASLVLAFDIFKAFDRARGAGLLSKLKSWDLWSVFIFQGWGWGMWGNRWL